MDRPPLTSTARVSTDPRVGGRLQLAIVACTIVGMLGAVKAFGAVPPLAVVLILMVLLLYRIARRAVERHYGFKPRPDGWHDPLERPLDALLDRWPAATGETIRLPDIDEVRR